MICGDRALRFQQSPAILGVFACMSLTEPRASTLRRIKGSVFEVRKLKRHSGNSKDTPSVRSRRKACGA